MATKTENLPSKKKPNESTEPVASSSTALSLLREQTSKLLSDYDLERASLAKVEGRPEPASLDDIWQQSCKQQDTNEMLRTNLMQMQVVFQELYQDLFAGQNKRDAELTALLKKLSKGDDPEDYDRYRELRKVAVEERSKMIKGIESFAKTIKQLSAEYRQGEMAKAQFYHVSEVRAQQMFVLAIMKQFISDQTLLNNMSDALETGFSKMGSLAEGNVDG